MNNNVDIEVGRYRICRIETITKKQLPVLDGLEIRKYNGDHGKKQNKFTTLAYIHANGKLESFKENLFEEFKTSKLDIKDLNRIIELAQELILTFNRISEYFDDK